LVVDSQGAQVTLSHIHISRQNIKTNVVLIIIVVVECEIVDYRLRKTAYERASCWRRRKVPISTNNIDSPRIPSRTKLVRRVVLILLLLLLLLLSIPHQTTTNRHRSESSAARARHRPHTNQSADCEQSAGVVRYRGVAVCRSDVFG
jgi:hypothetical protein